MTRPCVLALVAALAACRSGHHPGGERRTATFVPRHVVPRPGEPPPWIGIAIEPAPGAPSPSTLALELGKWSAAQGWVELRGGTVRAGGVELAAPPHAELVRYGDEIVVQDDRGAAFHVGKTLAPVGADSAWQRDRAAAEALVPADSRLAAFARGAAGLVVAIARRDAAGGAIVRGADTIPARDVMFRVPTSVDQLDDGTIVAIVDEVMIARAPRDTTWRLVADQLHAPGGLVARGGWACVATQAEADHALHCVAPGAGRHLVVHADAVVVPLDIVPAPWRLVYRTAGAVFELPLR
ncbi:MAG TPA: hypothetical protein VLX92_21675 [Kofleriaceae bacterium]|nr:hypothetical protein [Kofleriaceae bacterium]